MRPSYALLAVLVMVFLTIFPIQAAKAPWRGIDELPQYQYYKNPDPAEWVARSDEIKIETRMWFRDDWKGMRPIVNFYIGEGCDDPQGLAVYKREIQDAILYLMVYRDRFVEMYPQFSYLKKLKLQLTNGTIEKALNVPIRIPSGNCYSTARESWAGMFSLAVLNWPGAAFHEFVHVLGASHIYFRDESYYSFYTRWGWTGDIGINTITWYALALSWSWLYFYDGHPGATHEDYASKLPFKLKYRLNIYPGKDWVAYEYVVTAKDLLESGIEPRPISGVAELRLGGGAVIPAISLWPEDWMIGHPVLDDVSDSDPLVINDRPFWFTSLQDIMGFSYQRGLPVKYSSFSVLSDIGDIPPEVPWAPFLNVLDQFRTLTIFDLPPITSIEWTDPSKLGLLSFLDLRPDLYFCGFVYRWRDSVEERVLPVTLAGNESFRPSLRPGERLTYSMGCYYQWGPYIYRAPFFRFKEVLIPTRMDIGGHEYYRGIHVILGVPSSERVVQDSPGTRRVFSGVWLVNGTEWPGPYLDLDILGWKIRGEPPERPPSVGPWRITPSFTLYGPGGQGSPIYLDGFTQRYRGLERVPWMTGVTFLKLRHNTTAEPLYYREHFVNFTVPEGFRILDGDATGWYREGSRIKLPRLSNLTVSEGTVLVHEGWRGPTGALYKPGGELVVEGPVSLEPVLARYHRVSVRGPPEGVKAAGEGWYREGSTATLRLLENVTYVGERTRIVVHGFRIGNETLKEVSLRVDAPVEVEAVWERQHLLTVKSRFYNWSFENPWYTENATYMIVLPGDLQNLGNGTMIEVRGVEVVSGGERFVGTRLELRTINVTVGGTGYITLWNVSFTVRGPPEMRVHWTVRHAVEVSAPPGLASFEGLQSAAPPATVYAEEGERLVINLLQQESVNETRYVLRDVLLGNNSLGPVTRIEVDVTAPTRIVAVYRVQLLVWPRLRGPDGSVAEPDLVVLRSRLGEASSTGGSALWLDSYVTGPPFEWVEWRLVKAVYRGVEVTVDQALTPKAPGALYISAPTATLKVSVRDVFGMPVPLAHVSCDCPGGFLSAAAGTAGVAELGVVPHGKVTLRAMLLFRAEREVRVPEEGAELVLPVSPYTAGVAASLAPPIYLGVRRWRRGSSPRP
jgi:hypothetical protein